MSKKKEEKMQVLCEFCTKPSIYSKEVGGEEGEQSISEYIEENIHFYTCEPCQEKGKQIVYKENVYVCPVCNLNSEMEYPRREIYGPCTGCDGCNDWYHMSCLGINEDEAEGAKVFCHKCTKKRSMEEVKKENEDQIIKGKKFFFNLKEELEVSKEKLEETKEMMNNAILKVTELEKKIEDHRAENLNFQNEIGKKRRRIDEIFDEAMKFQPAQKKQKVE